MKIALSLLALVLNLSFKAYASSSGVCYHGTTCDQSLVRTDSASIGVCEDWMQGEYPFSWKNPRTHVCYVVTERGHAPRAVTKTEYQSKARPNGDGVCFHGTRCDSEMVRSYHESIGSCEDSLAGEAPFSWRSYKTHTCYVVSAVGGGAHAVSNHKF